MVALKSSTFVILFNFVLYIQTAKGQEHITYSDLQIERLNEALAQFVKIDESEWFYFSCDSCLHPGDQRGYIPLLRKNLQLTGNYLGSDCNSKFFDDTLHSALKHFQQRYGLTPDGTLNSETVEAMSVPLSSRINEIQLAITKWSLLDSIQEPFIMVNIPDYSLSVIDSTGTALNLKVIIGKVTTPTPQLISSINRIIVNPTWNVPTSIGNKEILSMIQHDNEYLSRNDMNVYTINHGKKTVLNPDTINWHCYNQTNFHYFFEQNAGSKNALGKIKFLFPNSYSVYLHDTQDKKLFNHRVRTYSHGCIRIQDPIQLAKYLFHREEWSNGHITDFLQSNQANQSITLQNPIPIIITYITCWVNDQQELQFRKDIYNLNNEISLIY
jgi:murein L,D-transpeptidase YcbB/YkuD